MNLKSKKGFTLVELIIVIAILGIIALIAVPNLTGVQKRSQVNADIRTAEEIGKAVRIWLTDGTLNETRDRESYIDDGFIELSKMTKTDVGNTRSASTSDNGLENYVSLTYEPNNNNASGKSLAFYITLKNNKVVVAIHEAGATTAPTLASTIFELSSDEIVEGVAYVEGISSLDSTNVAAALGLS